MKFAALIAQAPALRFAHRIWLQIAPTTALLCILLGALPIAAASSQMNVPAQPDATPSAHASVHALSAKGLFGYGIEGPAVDLEGNVYAVNFKENGTIGRMAKGKPPELWLTLPKGQVGSSLRMLDSGTLLVAERKMHQILKIDLRSKAITSLAQNKEMNQPNDLTLARTGQIFLSDPSWSSKKRGGIWIWENAKGLRSLLLDLKAVNGIALSPNEKTLYFTESVGGGVWAFDWDGSELKNKRLLHQYEADSVDGLRVNSKGDLFVARITKGRIDRLSTSGKLIASIETLGKDPTNLAFGGTDGKTIYVTQRDGRFIEAFESDSPGLEWINLKGEKSPSNEKPSLPVSAPSGLKASGI